MDRFSPAPDATPSLLCYGGEKPLDFRGNPVPTILDSAGRAGMGCYQFFHFCQLCPPDDALPDDWLSDASPDAYALFGGWNAEDPFPSAANRSRLGDAAVLSRHSGRNWLYPGCDAIAGRPGIGKAGGDHGSPDGLRYRHCGGTVRSSSNPGNRGPGA